MASAQARTKAFAAETKATLRKAGADGGKDMGGGIAGGIESGTRRGGQIVEGFASSTLSTFSRLGPLMGTAVAAGLVGAAASAGTAAGAVTLAVGGAITGIGVISAAQSERVRREWRSVGQDLKTGLADAAAPMERSAIRAATVTRSTFSRLKPFLANFFSDSAPAVDRFVQSIGDGVASLGPALEPLQRGYSAVLDAISARSPQIFGSLERSLANLGNTAEEHADDIAAAFQFVASSVEVATEAVGALADSWSDFTGDMSAAGDAGTDFGRSIGEALHDAAEGLGINTEAMKRQREAWDAADAAAAQGDGVKSAGEAAAELAGSARDAAAGLSDLTSEFERLTGAALDAAEAEIRIEEAIDAAGEAIRKNGRTLDVNTEKGRANKEAVLDIARAAQEHVAAMQAENRSTEDIAATYGRYRSQLVGTLRAAGATRGEAQRLAETWLKTPEQVTTRVKANIGDLQNKIATAKARLRDPKLTSPQRTAIRAQISDLQAKVRAAKAALASIRDKSVTIRSNYVTTHTYASGTASLSELIPGRRAHGGIIGGNGIRRFAQGGVAGAGSSLAMVGEQGPELVRLPVGSTVTGAGQTRAMQQQSGFGDISMAFRGGGSGGGSGGLAGSMRDLTKTLREVIGLREGMSRFTEGIFGQGRALMAYEEAWDRVRASMKENGKTLNISREKGRENRGALMDLADAAHQVANAMHDLGKPSSEIVAKMKEQRREFIAMARTFGLTSKEAAKLADKWGLLPAKVKSVLAKEKGDLAYNKKAEAFNASLDGKAAGGPAGGWTMVGERGAELVRLPFGSSVVPAGQSAAMMAGGGQPQPVVLELRSSGSAVDDMLLQILRKAVRVRGGNVQLVLGRA